MTSTRTLSPLLPHPRGWIPIWLHITLQFLFLLAGFCAGLVASFLIIYRFFPQSSHFFTAAFSLMIIFACVLLPQILLVKCIPARCRRCQGKCWGKMIGLHKPKTFHYVCANCHWQLDTRMGPD